MIMFRAYADGKMWYPDTNWWWFFSGDTDYWSLNSEEFEESNIICDSLESENPHIMQYTNLKDRNSKKIYEGDILDRIFVNGDAYGPSPVILDEGSFSLDCGGYKPCLYEVDLSIADIIGNIYENPELVYKGGKNECRLLYRNSLISEMP